MPSPHPLHSRAPLDTERSAWNEAFYELGLRWHWDDSTYERLATEPCERQRVRQYVRTMQPHLLTAYDADFLAEVVVQTKQRRQSVQPQGGSQAALRVNWADPRWGEVGI